MLSIKYGPHDGGIMSNTAWWIGSDSPLNHNEQEVVVSVTADGDELNWVLRTFKNLPYNSQTRVHRWFGDHAKLIAGNLR